VKPAVVFSPFIAGLLVSCNVKPTITTPGGYKLTLGASLLEKTAEESALVELPDGTRLAYSTKGKDQTMIAKEGIRAWATVAGITATADGLNEGEAIREQGMTARTISADSVKKADIAGEVKKTTTLVPPAFKPASSF